MASALIGGPMDIHAGGMDLKFPHHDNEIAQSEAYYPCQQWVNYFLHTGHLHIEGLKMSKSLKNFVTIRQALETCTARQLRLLFLFRAWDNVMNYSAAMLDEVRSKEKVFGEFFLLVKQVQREQAATHTVPQRWDAGERQMLAAVDTAAVAVDAALKDNFDTPCAMRALLELVSETNRYARSAQRRALLVAKAAAFVERILRVFGVIGDGERSFLDATRADGAGAAGGAAAIEPVVDVLAKFRHAVREAARGAAADPDPGALVGELQRLCDSVRDDALPPLGVRLEDDPNFPGAFKVVDAAALVAELAEKRAKEAELRRKKVAARVVAFKADVERAVAAAADPAALFRARTDEFGSFDDAGVPLTTADGEPLAKGLAKKVAKELKNAQSKHSKWLAAGGDEHTAKLRANLAAAEAELAELSK